MQPILRFVRNWIRGTEDILWRGTALLAVVGFANIAADTIGYTIKYGSRGFLYMWSSKKTESDVALEADIDSIFWVILTVCIAFIAYILRAKRRFTYALCEIAVGVSVIYISTGSIPTAC
jgi:hypothetical protein